MSFKYMRDIAFTLILLLSVSLISCVSYKDIELGDVKSVKLNKVSNGGLEIQADIQVSNPNKYKVKVKKIEADMFINGKSVGKIELNKKVVLPKKSNEPHNFVVSTQLSNILSAAPSMMFGGEINLQLKGFIKGKSFLFSKKFPLEAEKKVSSKDLNLF